MKTYLSQLVTPSPKSVWRFSLLWLLIFGLAILVRLPHFLSKNFWFDGDEAMVGIMAQDFLAGRTFPLYFYGQHYGLSTFEAVSTALFIALFGSGIWALRLGGLFLFSLGVTFVLRAVEQQRVARWVWLCILLVLVTFPTWYLWGAMVRGGYVTAFLCASVIFYALMDWKASFKQLLIVAFAVAIAFEAHVLILFPLFPLMATHILRHPNGFRHACFLFLIFVATVLAIRGVASSDVAYWTAPKTIWGWDHQYTHLQQQFHGLVAGYSNFFFFSMNIDRPMWWDVLLKSSLLISLVLLAWDLLSSFREKWRYYGWIGVVILVYLMLVSTVEIQAPRYWIGLFTGMMFWLIAVWVERSGQRVADFSLVFVALICMVGITTGSKMKQDWYDAGVHELRAFEGFHREVQQHHPKGIFITDNLIQWQWNYLYGNEIPASAFRARERTQAFCDRVHAVYRTHPDQVVIGGLWGMTLQMDTIRGFNDHRYQVETKYFIQPYARRDFVDQGCKTMNGE